MNSEKLGWSVRLSNRVDRFIGKLREHREFLNSLREAKTLREFKEIVELAKDPGTIELALVRAVSSLTGAALVELLLDSAQSGIGPSTLRIAGWPASALNWSPAEVDALGYPLSLGLWCGEQRRLALQVFEEPAKRRKGRLTPRLIRRLTELCAQAALAERALLAKTTSEPMKENASAFMGNPGGQRRSSRRDIPDRFLALSDSDNHSPHSAEVHDATYLIAVLPFAIAQASRHQEPLTILSIEAARDNSVVGGGANKIRATNQKIAEGIARSLRGSDVVALLDDSRIIIVLPDTSRTQANQVVEIIRSAIRPHHPLTSVDVLPPFRVGIASFPADAHDMPGLLIAADNAANLP